MFVSVSWEVAYSHFRPFQLLTLKIVVPKGGMCETETFGGHIYFTYFHANGGRIPIGWHLFPFAA